MALHLPSYVQDAGLSLTVGMTALALIGFGNIFGSYGAGWLGQRASKKWLLTWIYGLRALLIVFLMAAPKSAATMYAFAFGMGLLWLSTVPLTNALVAQIFGVKHVSMLSGVVFFGHQIGSFCGAWLGRRDLHAPGQLRHGVVDILRARDLRGDHVRAHQRAAARTHRGCAGLEKMNARTRNASLAFVGLCLFAVVSWMIFRGYLTPEMMVYFLSFKWCL